MMSKLNSTTLNALRTLFGARAASRLFKQSRGRASHILEEARASYGAGWDAIRAVHALMEQAFLETPASEIINSPTRAAPFLKARLAGIGYEVFAIVLLNAQHGVIAFEEVARGTISQTSVYPREIVKRALAWNAAALLCCHCHPSGVAEPSRADQILTRELQSALKLIDVQVLDHIIVAAGNTTSMAQLGLL
jgi:DNA repair protein RadC